MIIIENKYKYAGTIGLIVILTVVAGITLYPTDYRAILNEYPNATYIVLDFEENQRLEVLTRGPLDYIRWKYDIDKFTLYSGRYIGAEEDWLIYYKRTWLSLDKVSDLNICSKITATRCYIDNYWEQLVRKKSLIQLYFDPDTDKITIVKETPYYGYSYASGSGGTLIQKATITSKSPFYMFPENYEVSWIPASGRENAEHKLVWRIQKIEFINESPVGYFNNITEASFGKNVKVIWKDENKFDFGYGYQNESKILIYFKPESGTQILNPRLFDPLWYGYSADDFFTELISNDAYLTHGGAIFKVKNPTSLDFTVDQIENRFGVKFVKYLGNDIESWKLEILTNISENTTNYTWVYYPYYSINGTYIENGTKVVGWYWNNYTEWRKIKLNDVFKAGKEYIINLTATWKAKLGRQAVEWFPEIIIQNTTLTQNKWAWWDVTWTKKIPINISVSSGSTGTNYQMEFNITYNSNMQSDFDDLRFINATENGELPYWIEYKIDGQWANVWVKVDSDITTTNQTLVWLYYGNSSVSTTENGLNTFIFFEDWESGSVNTTKWTTRTATPIVVTANAKDTYAVNLTSTGILVSEIWTGLPVAHYHVIFWDENIDTAGAVKHLSQTWQIGISSDDCGGTNYCSYDGVDWASGGARSYGWHELDIYYNTTNTTWYLDNIGKRFRAVADNVSNSYVEQWTGGAILPWTIDNIYVTKWYVPTPIFNFGAEPTDTTPPTYSSNSTNSTLAGEPINHILVWNDDIGLSGYIFSTNNSGTWKNASFISFSGTSNTSWNVTISNSTVGTLVAWCFYANDTSNNWNGTSCQVGNRFTYTTTSPPVVNLYLNGIATNRNLELGKSINITATTSSGTVCLNMNHTYLGNNFICGTSFVTYLWNDTFSTTNKFNDSTTEKNLSYSSLSNKTVYLKMHSYDLVKNISLNLTGVNTSGDNYPANVKIYINDSLSNSLSGTLKEGVSVLNTFNDTTAAKNLTFEQSGSQRVYLKLGKNAIVIDAKLNLSGYNVSYANPNKINYYENSNIEAGTGCSITNLLNGNDTNWNTYAYCTAGETPSSSMRIYENYTYNSEWLNTETSNLSIRIKYTPTGYGNDFLYVWNYTSSSWQYVWLCPSCSGTRNATKYNLSINDFVSVGNPLRIYFAIAGGINCQYDYFESQLFWYNKSYPTNPYLDVEGDGDTEWSFSGEFNQTKNQTTNFSDSLNHYLEICTADIYGNCLIPLVVGSASAGKIQLDAISIIYNIYFNPLTLNIAYLQNYLDKSSYGYQNIPIKIEASQGNVTVNALNISFNGTGVFNITANASIVSKTQYISVYFSRFDVKLPSYIPYFEFIPKTNSSKNVTPYGQTNTIPIFNATSKAYDKAMNISIFWNTTNQTLRECANITIDKDNAKEGGLLISNGTQTIISNLTTGNWTGLWLWLDMNNCPGRWIQVDLIWDACCYDCMSCW